MTKKTFYINLKEQEFNATKAINKEIIFKSFVRETINTNDEIKIVDNNSNISNIYLKEKINIGSSLNLDTFILKNKYNNDLRLSTPLPIVNIKNKIAIDFKNKFSNLFKTKKEKKGKKDPVIILKPIKGGFHVYYSGIFGFLPQSQYWHAWKSILKNTKDKKNLLSMIELKQILPIRLPLKLSKISIYPANKSNNFSNSKRSRIWKNSLNVVFIHKKLKFKKNETKQDKKDTNLLANKSINEGANISYNRIPSKHNKSEKKGSKHFEYKNSKNSNTI
jgi:hypothetical protein